MRNVLNYYYNLYPKYIHQTAKYYKFNIDNITYILAIYNRDNQEINALVELTKILINYGVYIHQIIPNNNNEYITIINNISYVLLKVYVDLEKKITLTAIGQLSIINIPVIDNSPLKRNDWFSLWTNKIDYFEYQVNQFGIKYPIIRETFSYFVGLAETSIALFKNTNINNNALYIAHKRIKKTYTIDDLYNPLNIILDYRMRDACEYFKDAFFNDYHIDEEIVVYINNAHFSSEEMALFLARMIFPSFYFDVYEQILSEKQTEKALDKVVLKIVEYEDFLKRLYNLTKKYYNIPNIEWLNK